MVTISLLYYHIIDLVTSSKKQAVYQALNDAQIQQYRSDMRVEFKTDQSVVNFIMNVIKASANKPFMDALKDTKALQTPCLMPLLLRFSNRLLVR